MKILITGGAGCLGSNLIEHWLPQGHSIHVIDNFSTGKQELLRGIGGLTVSEGSVADAILVERSFDLFRPEIVVHAAASYKNPDDWLEDSASNIVGSINIAAAARKYETKRLVNFQTALCYGRPRQMPIPIDHRLAPASSYAISKTAGEQYMLLSGLNLISLRLANVCGPRLSIGPIPTFYKRLSSGQSCFITDTVRDFIDMSDFLAFMDLAVKDNAPCGIFNVSSGEAHSIKEIYELVARHLKIDAGNPPLLPPASDDLPLMVLDPCHTEKIFGWKPATSFSETINRQLAWYDRHGVNHVYSHLKALEIK